MDPAAAKQQIVDRVKQATNILVTVSNDPSVDQLAACIGLTLLLNRMEKHATAVFSGKVPSTLEFLQPEKTIETNTDSLRDFIISLDKNKADKLRYKVEDDVVRIFITPYRTSISEKDLQFSQGDFNVEVVIALGIEDRSQVDAAITAHGRILHDATVISLNAGGGKADLGQINWQEPSASSLCEMLVTVSEAFGPNLIDNQMATSFLTGIVAETKRFSNEKTSPKVMTIAAQLMAAGANQQLIISKLEPPRREPPASPSEPKEPPPPPDQPKPKPAQPLDGTLEVSHDKDKKDSPEVDVPPAEIHIDEQGNIVTTEEMLQRAKEKLEKERAAGGAAFTSPVPKSSPPPGPHSLLDPKTYQPSLDTPFTANTEPEWSDPYNTVPIDPLADGKNSGGSALYESSKKDEKPAPAEVADGENGSAEPDLDKARKAVESAPDSSLLTPLKALNSQSINLDEPAKSETPPADSGVNLSSAPAAPPPPVAPPLITTGPSDH